MDIVSLIVQSYYAPGMRKKDDTLKLEHNLSRCRKSIHHSDYTSKQHITQDWIVQLESSATSS